MEAARIRLCKNECYIPIQLATLAIGVQAETSYETTYNLSHAKAQSSQRKAFKMLINLAPLRLCEKIISFFGDQTVCPLAGGLADTRNQSF